MDAFHYKQLPTDQKYRDNFDDIFRKPEKEVKPKYITHEETWDGEGEDEDIGA